MKTSAQEKKGSQSQDQSDPPEGFTEEDQVSKSVGNDDGCVTVVGYHWSALLLVGLLVQSNRKVNWIENTGSHYRYPLSVLPSPVSLQLLNRLSKMVNLPLDPLEVGQFLRDFRNKSFQVPVWEDEVELWEAEQKLVTLNQSLSAQNFEVWLDRLRSTLEEHHLIDRVQGVRVSKIVHEQGEWVLELSSGERKRSQKLVWADSLESIRSVDGLKKTIQLSATDGNSHRLRFSDFNSKLHPVGTLQIDFQHRHAIRAEQAESFLMTPYRDSKETLDRKVMGYFSEDGLSSHWTVLLTHSEIENNHEITKKLRKLKQTLNRCFEAAGWLEQEGQSDFQGLIQNEVVRLNENSLWAVPWEIASPIEIQLSQSSQSFYALTDACGLASSLEQLEWGAESESSLLSHRLGESVQGSGADSENEDLNRQTLSS